MFASGLDSGHESGGLSASILIPTRFVWPYGGRRVLLSGSFTRLETSFNKIVNGMTLTGFELLILLEKLWISG